MLVAATPIDGGHYFIDVGAGALIAVGAIVIAHRLVRPSRGDERESISPVWSESGADGMVTRWT